MPKAETKGASGCDPTGRREPGQGSMVAVVVVVIVVAQLLVMSSNDDKCIQKHVYFSSWRQQEYWAMYQTF